MLAYRPKRKLCSFCLRAQYLLKQKVTLCCTGHWIGSFVAFIDCSGVVYFFEQTTLKSEYIQFIVDVYFNSWSIFGAVILPAWCVYSAVVVWLQLQRSVLPNVDEFCQKLWKLFVMNGICNVFVMCSLILMLNITCILLALLIQALHSM